MTQKPVTQRPITQRAVQRANTARRGSILYLAVSALCMLSSACGSHDHDSIPAELLSAIENGARDSSDYPAGPSGDQVGDIAPNVCVDGWLDPTAADYDATRMEPICFADFWDPEQQDHRLLLVNTAAIWCSACQVEYQGSATRPSLSAEASARQERGLRVLGTLFQDASLNPATRSDGVRWAQSFEVDFPFGVDADFEMGAFADPSVQPFNLLIDTSTMEIIFTLQGDFPGQLWPLIDEQLASL
jgi:hypothetical protein